MAEDPAGKVPEDLGGVIGGSLRRRLAGDSAWAFGGRIGMLFFGVLASAMITRLLEPAEAGLYFLMFSIASSGAVIAELGLDRVGTRLVAEGIATGEFGRAGAAIRKVAGLGVLSALGAFALLATPVGGSAMASVFGSPQLAMLAPAVGCWIALRALGHLRAEVFRGLHEIRFASLYGGVDAYVLLCVLLGFMLLTPDLGSTLRIATWGSGLVWLPGLLVGWVALHRRQRRLTGAGSAPVKEIAVIAWPLWLMGLGQLAIQNADLWILAIWVSPEEVAVYGAVLRLIGMISLPLLVMNAVVPPLIAGMSARGENQRLSHILQTTAAIAGLPALCVLLILGTAGGPILSVIFGDFYARGAVPLALLGLGQATNVWSGSCALVLALTGHERTLMRITLASGGCMIVAVLVLVGPFGSVGVAVGASGGVALKNYWAWRAARERTGIRTHISVSGMQAALRSVRNLRSLRK